MRLFAKVLVVSLALAAVFLAAFGAWGGWMGSVLSPVAAAAWFASIRPYAWAVAIALLAADLLLPIPATGVFAALGSVYGPILGGLAGAAGSVAAGLLGYGLARLAGRRATRRLASEEELERFRGFFDRWGGLAVILSRALPILPEVVSVLAGLAPMKMSRYMAALLLGALPTALLFAWLGHASRAEPVAGALLAVLLPGLLWLPLKRVFVARQRQREGPG